MTKEQLYNHIHELEIQMELAWCEQDKEFYGEEINKLLRLEPEIDK